ncbi:MAG TPA: arginyltransferase [Stellaceae bacterium]|nr:arginyltransferase [Stellaceae bacterium]
MPEGHGSGKNFVGAVGMAPERLSVAPQHFYRTSALPCPYLPGKVERKLVTELAGRQAAAFYNDLSRAGFRRSHHVAYRPACVGCSACVPVRIPVAHFVESRSLRRIRNTNRDILRRSLEAEATLEQFRLFQRYQRSRHSDSDMAAMTFGDYQAMVEDSPVATRMIELRDAAGALWGTGLYDPLDDGLSAVYSFYAPEAGKRSLGTLLVLALVDEARRRRLPFVYLGYWIADSAKMSYKARFHPLEALGPQGWRTILE